MPTSVRLSQQNERRLESLSRETGKPKAFYIEEAITSYLDDLEDCILAEKRGREVREGKARTYSLKEVEQELGLER